MNQATVFTDFGQNATANAKGIPGLVVGLVATNANAAVRYLQIHNTTTTPEDQAVPLLSFAIGKGATGVPGVIAYGQGGALGPGVWCSAGISFGFSTTQATYTAATAADHSIHLLFM